MELGNIILNWATHCVNLVTGKVDLWSLMSGNNIFATLAVMFSILWLIDTIKQRKKWILFIPVFLLSFLVIFLEGGIYLLPIVLLSYFFMEIKRNSAYQ